MALKVQLTVQTKNRLHLRN